MKSKRAVVVTRFPLQFDRDTGSQRLLAVIEFLLEAGWAVSYLTQVPGEDERYSRHLQQRGIPVYAGFGTDVQELLAGGDLALAVILWWEAAEAYIPLLRAMCPGIRIIIDSNDLNFLRNARRTFLRQKGEGAAALLDADYAADAVRELNSYSAADYIIAISQKEADLIGDFLADPNRVCELTLSEDLAASTLPFGERRGMLFTGNFRHPPNAGAVEFLCRDILPRLDPCLTPAHPVYIVGNGMNQLVRSYGNGLPYVRMLGWVPDIRPYLEQVRVALVPLQYGAGVKGKVIQSLMTGTPVVSTSIGVEGMDVTDGENVMIADDAAAFSEKIATVLQDQQLWERLSRSGREQMIRMHGRQAIKSRFLEIVDRVLEREPKAAVLPTLLELRPLQSSPLVADRIREIVGLMLPSQSPIVLFSPRTGETFGLEGRVRWWLPPHVDEPEASPHSRDRLAPIQNLEAIRRAGAKYLLVPTDTSWLLDQHTEFHQHIDTFYPCLWSDENCTIYELNGIEQPAS